MHNEHEGVCEGAHERGGGIVAGEASEGSLDGPDDVRHVLLVEIAVEWLHDLCIFCRNTLATRTS